MSQQNFFEIAGNSINPDVYGQSGQVYHEINSCPSSMKTCFEQNHIRLPPVRHNLGNQEINGQSADPILLQPSENFWPIMSARPSNYQTMPQLDSPNQSPLQKTLEPVNVLEDGARSFVQRNHYMDSTYNSYLSKCNEIAPLKQHHLHDGGGFERRNEYPICSSSGGKCSCGVSLPGITEGAAEQMILPPHHIRPPSYPQQQLQRPYLWSSPEIWNTPAVTPQNHCHINQIENHIKIQSEKTNFHQRHGIGSVAAPGSALDSVNETVKHSMDNFSSRQISSAEKEYSGFSPAQGYTEKIGLYQNYRSPNGCAPSWTERHCCSDWEHESRLKTNVRGTHDNIGVDTSLDDTNGFSGGNTSKKIESNDDHWQALQNPFQMAGRKYFRRSKLLLMLNSDNSPAAAAALEMSDFERRCFNCNTTTTSTWRFTDVGELLCNACGLYHKMHRKMRPNFLFKDQVRRRRGRGTRPSNYNVEAVRDQQ